MLIIKHVGCSQHSHCLLILLQQLSRLLSSVRRQRVEVVLAYASDLCECRHNLVDQVVLNVRVTDFILENCDHLRSNIVSELIELFRRIHLVDAKHEVQVQFQCKFWKLPLQYLDERFDLIEKRVLRYLLYGKYKSYLACAPGWRSPAESVCRARKLRLAK